MDFYTLSSSIYFLKILFISLCTYYTFKKITNIFIEKKQKIVLIILLLVIISIFITVINSQTNSLVSITIFAFLLGIILGIIINKNNIGNSIVITVISLTFNYLLFFMSTIVAFIISRKVKLENDFVTLVILSIVHVNLLKGVFKIKKLKHGITFLKIESNNGYLDILVLNLSVIILFSTVLFTNREILLSRSVFFCILLATLIMFITIQKSIQLYYKQKLLVQELKETKNKLEEKTKEVKELEEENIKISKKSHTLVHKQKSLEYKIEEMMSKAEISKEEAGKVIERIKEINKELYKEKTTTELDKTEIPQIDDILKYMQSECKKNNIDFELQIKGNIHHMTNNLISKEDLETLLADHIKNAIIAINHTSNINRSILIRLGLIDECYGLYIYDSGIEFEKETLQNLGKKPSTTHANEGGTGMGFMNTFDTLRKCNASLIIEEYNKPSTENYTKVIMIKFDNKNEFKIKTYRENEVNKK